MSDFATIQQSIINGNVGSITGQVQHALDNGHSAQIILNEGLLVGMGVVGDRFKRNEMFLPQVLMAAQTMQQAIDRLKPLLAGDGESDHGPQIVIGTVMGDMHDIGKNLVKIMLVGAGFQVIDLGVNVTAQAFKDAVTKHTAAVVCLSALLSSTMNQMRSVVEAFRADTDLSHVKILVGGAPVNREFAAEIGADGYAPTAPQAVDLVKELVAEN